MGGQGGEAENSFVVAAEDPLDGRIAHVAVAVVQDEGCGRHDVSLYVARPGAQSLCISSELGLVCFRLAILVKSGMLCVPVRSTAILI